jgi:hypothetical protein
MHAFWQDEGTIEAWSQKMLLVCCSSCIFQYLRKSRNKTCGADPVEHLEFEMKKMPSPQRARFQW